MICITGDTHGEVSRLQLIQNQNLLKPEDYLIVAGDFGFVFYGGGRDPISGLTDDEKLDMLAEMPFNILFVDGNHERFPDLGQYPVTVWNGGKVHFLRPNVVHLMRGQVYEIEGQRILAMGGGFTIDGYRRTPGRDWWPDNELPTDEEYAEAWANLAAHDNRVDVIISHAAPDQTMEMLRQRQFFSDRYTEEMRLNCFLEDIRCKVAHTYYYFGHLHLDQELWRGQTALYEKVYRMDTRELVFDNTVDLE